MMHRLSGLLLLLVGLFGCSDAQLGLVAAEQQAPLDNKISIHSQLCLSLPGEVVFPVKVVFVIDTSTSMEISDPVDTTQRDPLLATGRVRAITKVLDTFKDQPGFEVAMVKFGASSNVLTSCGMQGPCFIANTTANQGRLRSAAIELNPTNGTTDYQAALDITFQLISDDIKKGDMVSLARSRYLVLFMSDGLPFPQLADTNNPSTILKVVGNLMTLKDVNGLGDLRVHTALLATDKPDFIRAQEEVVLKAMAQRGKGLYRSFENGERINFLNFGIASLRRAFALKSFMAVPLSTVPVGGLGGAEPGVTAMGATGGRLGVIDVDSDGDGLPDEQERHLGTSRISVDSDGDGFTDQLEHRFRASGFDPLDPGDADCGLPDDRLDDDRDGERNCEERFLGTSRSVVDTDGDGFPDGVELRSGTDPTSRDIIDDTDQDGTSNALELLAHTDPLQPDAGNRSLLAQRYGRRELSGAEVSALGVEQSRPCLDLTVDNVALLQTLPGGLLGSSDRSGGWNRILLWAGEVPFDDDNDRGSWRVACVQGRFFSNGDKYPPEGRVEVPREAWVSVKDRDALTCIGAQP